MLLDPDGWRLAQAIDDVLPALSPELSASVSAETHAGALELATGAHRTSGGVATELSLLRTRLAAELEPLGLRAGVAGTHPLAEWEEMRVSGGARYQLLRGTLRDLVQREPTFALHVHVAVRDPEVAVDVANRLRAHLPLLLALSANSPFWRGTRPAMTVEVRVMDAVTRVEEAIALAVSIQALVHHDMDTPVNPVHSAIAADNQWRAAR
jgi:glutamate---cysteine ligase / carboxylate-amine ligase